MAGGKQKLLSTLRGVLALISRRVSWTKIASGVVLLAVRHHADKAEGKCDEELCI